jgi:hypothetical protein
MYFVSLPRVYLGLRQRLLIGEDGQNMAGISPVNIT